MPLTAVREALPWGSMLDDDGFRRRHRWLQGLLVAHVPALAAFGIARGEALTRVGAEVALVGLLAWLSAQAPGRRLAATTVAAGLVLASVVLVQLADGAVEARFHTLLLLGVVALYQDWVPFLATLVLAIAALVADAVLAAEPAVTDAALHAGILVVASVLQVLLWRAVEDEHEKGRRLAGELARAQSQIEARESVSELFVNLARRNQALLDRQIDLIVGMEEQEAEPDQLAQLFQLDHLATRIRRNAESLLVLSGEEPARRWGRPVPLTDVVRAAVAEVEDYRRVDVSVDETIAVAGRAVADLAHLLAELIENGLQFSPPESRVLVTSRVHGDRGCTVAVQDRGIGLAELDLSSANDLLARPPDVDLRLSKRLGFHVVSRLAARYRLAVRLAATPGGGTTASVVVPEDLLAPLDAPAPVAPSLPAPRPPIPPGPGIPTVAGRVLVGALPSPAPGGLPRRVPQASLDPELRAAAPVAAPTPSAERRSPDEVRSMLSRFQAGQARGRTDAGREEEP